MLGLPAMVIGRWGSIRELSWFPGIHITCGFLLYLCIRQPVYLKDEFMYIFCDNDLLFLLWPLKSQSVRLQSVYLILKHLSHQPSITTEQSCEIEPFDIRHMSGQVSRGSAGEYQADEWAGVARLSWRVSGR